MKAARAAPATTYFDNWHWRERNGRASNLNHLQLNLRRQRRRKRKTREKARSLQEHKKNQKEEKNDEKLDDLEDMAFLDAQIESVQTSHGRKVEGKGKGYRSIVNGILLSNPSPREEPKRNHIASSALQSKLKSKAQGRKVKKKPK
mmetsp:Transcript_21756/g.52607  ORF Transcript_21756/g.52607 Transcript_21756/m.52607 type:complete len:146 (-) Transcript_21756:70-507(-)